VRARARTSLSSPPGFDSPGARFLLLQQEKAPAELPGCPSRARLNFCLSTQEQQRRASRFSAGRHLCLVRSRQVVAAPAGSCSATVASVSRGRRARAGLPSRSLVRGRGVVFALGDVVAQGRGVAVVVDVESGEWVVKRLGAAPCQCAELSGAQTKYSTPTA
jgi:hypothetical protein